MLISSLCCSEGERVSMCVYNKERGEGGRWRDGGRDWEAACASTHNIPHSRLTPLCYSPTFLSHPFLLSVFSLFLDCLAYFFTRSFFFSLPFPFPLIVPLSLSPLLQFSHLLFLHCTPKMTPLILRSRSRQPPDQPQHPSEELGHWASRARICPF